MPVGTDDVVFDFDQIQKGCANMATKLSDISKELVSLEGVVSGLLQNGLVFEKASPAMKDAYYEFSRQMKDSAANIKTFAETFKKIADGMAQSDSELAIAIRKAQAEMAAGARK
ncbi:hypothetical protein [Streptomyces sp. NPDC091371]|uniref:hypothetical protein n=1 Tax=Streptomyces sp. NPDC091371 TaxID=3155303 RepID=UPI00342A9E9E